MAVETPIVFLSAVMMFRRFVRVLRHAWHEEDFARIAGAAFALVIIGTVTYTLGGVKLAKKAAASAE